jgi:hypothetical protein
MRRSVRRGGTLLLMEVELIEPYLFFATAPDAMDAYVDLIARRAARPTARAAP